MGIVYKAEDPNLDRVVALKTILLQDDADGRAEYQKRFFLEAKAAGKLNHPNIVTTFDCGEDDGMAYLAMELVEGDRPAQAPAPSEAVPPARGGRDRARRSPRGSRYAHERGVVHRDIKPANIMLRRATAARRSWTSASRACASPTT